MARLCTDAGVDGIFLAGAQTREEIEAIHKATPLPLLLGSTPPALSDRAFLAAHGVRIALQGHVPFQWLSKRCMMPTNTSRKAAHRQG